MQKAKLENWAVVQGKSNPYMAPEAIPRLLRGEVYGHPDFTDGEKITSSSLTLLEGGIGKTQNTTYSLGFPEGEYAAWCIRNGYNVWKGP
jgi:hypothetical protein